MRRIRKSINQNGLAKGLGLLCWGFKGVLEEIPSEEASTLKIGSMAFPPGHCTTSLLVTYLMILVYCLVLYQSKRLSKFLPTVVAISVVIVLVCVLLSNIFPSMWDSKGAQMYAPRSLFRECKPYEFELNNNIVNILVEEKVKTQLISVQWQNAWRNLAWVARTSTIRKG